MKALSNFFYQVHCPKPDCQMMIQAQPEYGFCPSCEYSFCTACFRPFHGSTPCGLTDVEMQERMRKYVTADEAEKRRMDEEEKQARKVQDDESEKLIKNIYKKCPSCPTNIEVSCLFAYLYAETNCDFFKCLITGLFLYDRKLMDATN